MRKRKICFIITSKIHYSRNKILLDKLNQDPAIELQLVVGASAILEMYSGNLLEEIKEDGFVINAEAVITLSGGTPVAMANTVGIGVIEFSSIFNNLKPDIVIIRGDRYEVIAAAIAAAYLNITIAHIEGGDVTGTIDESVRHAITKLAHIHFATNEAARQRIIRMGEDTHYVFDVGSVDIEMISRNNFQVDNAYINRLGVGDMVDVDKPFIIVMQHPVTSEFGTHEEKLLETLHAVKEADIPAIWFWPNVDAGSDEISKAIRRYRENEQPAKMRFLKYLPHDEFIGLLKRAHCLVGNSSSGIKECSYLGVPAVNIGTRQAGRLRTDNVLDAGYDRGEILAAIKSQVEKFRYSSSNLYYKTGTSGQILKILKEVELYSQKKFID